MGIEQKLCEVKIFQSQSMSSAIRFQAIKGFKFAFKNSLILCLAST